MASIILLLPLPFGPTTAVTPETNSMLIRSANDLKPTDSRRFKNIFILLNKQIKPIYYCIQDIYLLLYMNSSKYHCTMKYSNCLKIIWTLMVCKYGFR